MKNFDHDLDKAVGCPSVLEVWLKRMQLTGGFCICPKEIREDGQLERQALGG